LGEISSLRLFLYGLEILAFLLSISVHESAHAFVADLNGDPTARQLGRVSLNPIRHIDPFGTVLFPLIGLISGAGIFGWAKPTPVIGRNFRNYRVGDITTTLAGPVSNFLLAIVCAIVLAMIAWFVPGGKQVLYLVVQGALYPSSSALVPISLLLYFSIHINIILGIFNLIPVPPLDGSHIIRHILPEPMLRLYDRIGIFGLVLLFFFGGRFLFRLITPVLAVFDAFLLQFSR
jgi:Zn-dependent protease